MLVLIEELHSGASSLSIDLLSESLCSILSRGVAFASISPLLST